MFWKFKGALPFFDSLLKLSTYSNKFSMTGILRFSANENVTKVCGHLLVDAQIGCENAPLHNYISKRSNFGKLIDRIIVDVVCQMKIFFYIMKSVSQKNILIIFTPISGTV